jgi:hypothetical protein
MWSDDVDEIITNDQAFTFGYVTPAKGVVLSPLTNFAIRDRAAGTMSNGNTSVGTWKKLARMQENSKVAMAFHTREHSSTRRPEYVLVQGRATFPWPPPRNYVATISQNIERFGGITPTAGRIWTWWMRDFLWRVPINIIVWADHTCTGPPTVYGARCPTENPATQTPPKNGTAPRLNPRRAARRARSMPHILLGWVGADGFPMIVPVDVHHPRRDGLALRSPAALLPPGSRRAGLTAHRFSRYTWGQTLRKHTGWLEVNDPTSSTASYAPHTYRGYSFPPSKLLFTIVAGAVTRLGVRQARRAGYLP